MSRKRQKTACAGSSETPVSTIAQLLTTLSEVVAAPQGTAATQFANELTTVSSDDKAIAFVGNAANRVFMDEAAPCLGQTARTLLYRVKLPTVRHLVCASLDPLHSIIARTCSRQDPDLRAACHIILGCALRLRSRRMGAYTRATTLIGAQRAFDEALTIYCARNGSSAPGARDAARGPAPCTAEPDGAQLIAQVIAMPIGKGTGFLEQAVLLFREARAQSSQDTTSWQWIADTNNLSCALTLLGNRAPASKGIAMLHEAVDILQQALDLRPGAWRREDRVSTHINLSEALLAIAERGMPAERLKNLEHAVAAAADALLIVGPREYAWLVQLAHGELA